mmetsp:Transcript_5993/g.12005  ORF Transcript_5993/g.12005 Transcript_5993/m.12005 type:complete len:295 (+) Transcript_5993:203-1087(+)
MKSTSSFILLLTIISTSSTIDAFSFVPISPHPLTITSHHALSEAQVSTVMEIKPVSTTSARSSGLALSLDDGTRKSHSVAENTAFVTGFFKGISTKRAFSQLVASLYFVYDGMERAFEASSDSNVKALDYPELRRVDTLCDDMEFYFGKNWRETVKPSPATTVYVNRISEIKESKPYLLVAHMYTRYLGDLFGGQMMGGMARSSLKLEDGKGTKFYEFDDIENTKDFIENWYAKLNTLELTDSQKQDIVDEGNLVFKYNIDLFNELEGSKRVIVKTCWKLFKDAVKNKIRSKKD